MKKVFQIAMLAALVLPLMVSCKGKNVPDDPSRDNKWTDAEPGSEEWFEDLITGEESDEIKTFSEADFVGYWRKVASAKTDKQGEILRWSDDILYSEIDRGHVQSYMELKRDMTSIYYQYLMNSGYPVLGEQKGTWSLDGNNIALINHYSNGDPYIDDEHLFVELVEKERIVLSVQYRDGEGKSCMYYVIYQRETGLPDVSQVQLPVDRLVGSPWKVVADTLYITAWNRGPGGTIEKQADVDKEANMFAKCVFTFKRDSTFTVKDAGGATKTYKWSVPEDTWDPTYISFTVKEISDKWPSPVKFYTIWLPANETSMKLFGGTGERMETPPAGWDEGEERQEIYLDPVK